MGFECTGNLTRRAKARATLSRRTGEGFKSTYLPDQFRMEQPVQAGGWFLTTAIALICILRRNVPLHRAWMMRSYAFRLIFILSRVPDAFPSINLWSGGTVTLLWWLIVAALLVPEIVLTVRELARRPGRAGKV